MIKAIIKLIESWAYRCEHDWTLDTSGEISDRHDNTKAIVRVYRCTKCCDFKSHRENAWGH